MQHCHSLISLVAPRRFNFGAFKAVLLHREWLCCELLIFLGVGSGQINRSILWVWGRFVRGFRVNAPVEETKGSAEGLEGLQGY